MPNDPNGPVQPEYLGDAPVHAPETGRRRGAPVLALAAVAVVGVVAAGGWAAVSLMSAGTQPAAAIPANAIGYVSLDLDPSAAQKIEAFEILRKFPAIEENMKISGRDDLRRWVFEQAQEDGQCKDVDYDDDIAPWIGDRVAFAGVPGDKAGQAPTPLLALQVTDAEAASEGLTRLAECGDAGEDFGVAVSGDYALISDSQKHADALVAAAAESSLADDAGFQKWTSRVGDPGIVTMYAAPGAVDALIDAQTATPHEFMAGGASNQRQMLRQTRQLQMQMDREAQAMKDVYGDFGGMAAVIRFEDGSVEAEFAADATPDELKDAVSRKTADLSELPADTAAAFAVSLDDGWAQGYLDLMGGLTGEGRMTDQMLKEAEAESGLELPEDLERLLGDGVAVALSSDMDVRAATQDPTNIPAGVRITGDPQEIQAVLDKVKKAVGPDADILVSEPGDGVLAVGLRGGYVRSLAADGALGDQDVFADVVPDAEQAGAAMFVDLDAVETWVAQVMDQFGAPEGERSKVRENLAPLRAVGVSSWYEDDGSQHGVLRVTTD